MKHLVIVGGHAGSGKTEFSKLLAARTGWVRLDKDTLTRPLVEALAESLVGDPNDRDSDAYVERIRPLEYRALLDTTWELLDCGVGGVIVCAPFVPEFFNRVWIDDLDLACSTKGWHLTLVWMHCDQESLKRRIMGRDADRDRWKVQNWPEWFGSLREPPIRRRDMRFDNSTVSKESLRSAVDDLVDRLSAV